MGGFISGPAPAVPVPITDDAPALRGQEQTFAALPKVQTLGRFLLHYPPNDPTAVFLTGSHGVDQACVFRKHRRGCEAGAKIQVVAMSIRDATKDKRSVATITLIVRGPENDFGTFPPI